MKATFAVAAALAQIVAAQELDFDQILAAPSPSVTGPPVGVASQSQVVTVNSASLQSYLSATVVATTASITGAEASAAATEAPSVEKRDACATQPAGTGPQVQPDTVSAFLNYNLFQAEAELAPTPPKYEQVFVNLNGSVNSNSYLTYEVLDSYNVSACAAFCDSVNLCTSFNIYVERDPSVDPGDGCPNPPSISNYKCSVFGSSIDSSEATNTGQYRDNFQVVIAASNGYDASNNTTPATLPDYEPPVSLGSVSISAGGDYFISANFFPGPFNPSLCAVFAQTQIAANRAHSISLGLKAFTPVNQFNTYYVTKNSLAQGTYCALFDTPLDSSWANFEGGWKNSDYFDIQTSYTYTLSVQSSGTI